MNTILNLRFKSNKIPFTGVIDKATFLRAAERAFDKEIECSDDETVANGGAVSQFLFAYGATAERCKRANVKMQTVLDDLAAGEIDTWLGVAYVEAGDRKEAAKKAAEARKAELERLKAAAAELEVLKAELARLKGQA